MSVWYTLKKSDAKTIKGIAQRVADCIRNYGLPVSAQDLEMSLIVCHTNGQDLNLAKLASFRDFDLLHDVLGIYAHLNKETGELENRFVPRCAR